MKKSIVAICFVMTQFGCAIASPNTDVVDRSIGELVLFHDARYSYQHDLNPFGSAKVYELFFQIYNKQIKGLPEEDRVMFFWSSMWHLDFDGHSMAEFQMLALTDCGDLLISKLEEYIKKETELQRNKSKLYLSKKVLGGLKHLQQVTRKTEP